MLKPKPTIVKLYRWQPMLTYLNGTHGISFEPVYSRMYQEYDGKGRMEIPTEWLYDNSEQLVADAEKTADIQHLLKIIFDEFGDDEDIIFDVS